MSCNLFLSFRKASSSSSALIDFQLTLYVRQVVRKDLDGPFRILLICICAPDLCLLAMPFFVLGRLSTFPRRFQLNQNMAAKTRYTRSRFLLTGPNSPLSTLTKTPQVNKQKGIATCHTLTIWGWQKRVLEAVTYCRIIHPWFLFGGNRKDYNHR